MILGYKSNYDKRLWIKIITSMLITISFFLVFVYFLFNFLMVYMEWTNYFLDLMIKDTNFQSPALKDFEKIDSDINAIYLMGKHMFVLFIIFGGGILFITHIGSKYSLGLAGWINKKLNLIPIMKLSFRKVNPSRIDPLIKWLKWLDK